MAYKHNYKAAALDLEGATAGTVVAGPTLITREVMPGTLSAKCVVDAETSGITLAALWQGSEDGATWVDASLPNNAANVVLATGTGGADAPVTKAVSAPDAVYGFRFARCSIVVGAQTGTSNDTANVGYFYQTD